MAIESKVNNISEPISQPNYDRLIKAYTLMHTSRQLDHKMLNLIKQGKGFFHIGGAGHEAAQLAAALNLKGGEDWSFPYYRDIAYVLGMGMTAEEIMMCFISRTDVPNSGVRQIPAHYVHSE